MPNIGKISELPALCIFQALKHQRRCSQRNQGLCAMSIQGLKKGFYCMEYSKPKNSCEHFYFMKYVTNREGIYIPVKVLRIVYYICCCDLVSIQTEGGMMFILKNRSQMIFIYLNGSNTFVLLLPWSICMAIRLKHSHDKHIKINFL